MNECVTNTTCHFTSTASLAALGVKVQQLKVFEPIHRLELALYDQRGGGVETSFKGRQRRSENDQTQHKHYVLTTSKRMKIAIYERKRFEAQQMIMLLGTLAHHASVWAHVWLTTPQATAQAALTPEVAEPSAQNGTPLQRYGILRMVRNVFHVSSYLCVDPVGQVVEIVLNQGAFLARCVINSLRLLLFPMQVAVNLGQTQVFKWH